MSWLVGVVQAAEVELGERGARCRAAQRLPARGGCTVCWESALAGALGPGGGPQAGLGLLHSTPSCGVRAELAQGWG